MTRTAAIALSSILVSGCAAAIPSGSTGTSEALFTSGSAIPARVAIRTELIQHYDPVGDVLRIELPAQGFVVTATDADATFVVDVKYSDYSPVELTLTLRDAASDQVLWRAYVVKKWDLYASVVSASESNARRALQLLRRDVAAHKE
ncbi:MAG: hypothetical protein HC809_00420 [Gammaproteobacteria bacterium]|nr:hypothetical protein [Gammaproteobacteria bacterium]